MTALLDVQVRRKRFGDREVLADVRLRLAAGETVSLVGASGCGKSTLLRLIAGLDRDWSGRITLEGRPVDGPTRDIRFVFQEPRLFPWLSVAGNVGFDLGGDLGRHAARIAALLDEVGLAGFADRLPKQLSGGQAQRVALARGLLVRPKVLLLDEPFSAVDAFTRRALQDLLRRVATAHGIAVLLVTHDIDEAVRLSDRVLVLEADPGRIRADIAVAAAHPHPHPHPHPHLHPQPQPQPQPQPRDRPDNAAAIREVHDALRAAHAF